MSKTAMVRARIEPALKSEVDALLRKLGLSASQAIGLFYRQIQRQRRLPFDSKTPNATTRKVFGRTDRGIGLKSFKSKEDFFTDLGLR